MRHVRRLLAHHPQACGVHAGRPPAPTAAPPLTRGVLEALLRVNPATPWDARRAVDALAAFDLESSSSSSPMRVAAAGDAGRATAAQRPRGRPPRDSPATGHVSDAVASALRKLLTDIPPKAWRASDVAYVVTTAASAKYTPPRGLLDIAAGKARHLPEAQLVAVVSALRFLLRRRQGGGGDTSAAGGASGAVLSDARQGYLELVHAAALALTADPARPPAWPVFKAVLNDLPAGCPLPSRFTEAASKSLRSFLQWRGQLPHDQLATAPRAFTKRCLAHACIHNAVVAGCRWLTPSEAGQVVKNAALWQGVDAATLTTLVGLLRAKMRGSAGRRVSLSDQNASSPAPTGRSRESMRAVADPPRGLVRHGVDIIDVLNAPTPPASMAMPAVTAPQGGEGGESGATLIHSTPSDADERGGGGEMNDIRGGIVEDVTTRQQTDGEDSHEHDIQTSLRTIDLIVALGECAAATSDAAVRRAARFHIESLAPGVVGSDHLMLDAVRLLRAMARVGALSFDVYETVVDGILAGAYTHTSAKHRMRAATMATQAVAFVAEGLQRGRARAPQRCDAITMRVHRVLREPQGVVGGALVGHEAMLRAGRQYASTEGASSGGVFAVIDACTAVGAPLPDYLLRNLPLAERFRYPDFGVEFVYRCMLHADAVPTAVHPHPDRHDSNGAIDPSTAARGFIAHVLANPAPQAARGVAVFHFAMALSLLAHCGGAVLPKAAVQEVLRHAARAHRAGPHKTTTGATRAPAPQSTRDDPADTSIPAAHLVLLHAAASLSADATALREALRALARPAATAAGMARLPRAQFLCVVDALQRGMVVDEEVLALVAGRAEEEVALMRAGLALGPGATAAGAPAARAPQQLLRFHAQLLGVGPEGGGGLRVAPPRVLSSDALGLCLEALARLRHRSRPVYLAAAEVLTAQPDISASTAVRVLWAYARQAETAPRQNLATIAMHTVTRHLQDLHSPAAFAKLAWATHILKLPSRVTDTLVDEIEARCATPAGAAAFHTHPTTTTRLLQSVAQARGTTASYVQRALSDPRTFGGAAARGDGWTSAAVGSLCMASLLVDCPPHEVHVRTLRRFADPEGTLLRDINNGDACAVLSYIAGHRAALQEAAGDAAPVVDTAVSAILRHLSQQHVVKTIEPQLAVLLLSACVKVKGQARDAVTFANTVGRALADSGGIYRMTPAQCVEVMTRYAELQLSSPRLHAQLCMRLAQPNVGLRQDSLADAVWAAAVLRLTDTPQTQRFWEALPHKRGDMDFSREEKATIEWALRTAGVETSLILENEQPDGAGCNLPLDTDGDDRS